MPATTSEKTRFVLETSSLRFVQVEAPDHQSALIAAQLLACEAHDAFKNDVDYYALRSCIREWIDNRKRVRGVG